MGELARSGRCTSGWVATAAGAAVLALGTSGMVGWILGIEALKSISPAWVSMKPNTAAGFILSGVALWLAAHPTAVRARRALYAVAGVVTVLGAMTCVEYLAHIDLRIDQLLFSEPPNAVSTVSPGRMALITALSFFLFGGALTLRNAKRVAWVAQLTAVAVVAISLTALLGYLYGTEMDVGGAYPHMALHTATAFLVMGVGLFATATQRGLGALSAKGTASGSLTRTLLPVLIAIVLGFSLARVYGERAGLFGAEVGASVLTVASLLAVCTAVWVAARSLARAERERDLARATLVEQEKTRAQELEREVSVRTAELASAMRELETFSYSVSHDLRAPLRSILGFSVILEEDAGPRLGDDERAHLELIRSSAERMNQLIDDLLELSRVHRTAMDCTEVDLSELVHEIVATLRARDRGRQVDVDVEPSIKATVDRRLFQIALENIIGNAWKFTGKSARARVDVGIDESGALFVRDNGAGFDMTYADKLFAPFQRFHTASEFEGTGIGLATVHRVVARHGGRVWAESKVGEGTTLFLELPSLRSDPLLAQTG